jgi:hypothetical protein
VTREGEALIPEVATMNKRSGRFIREGVCWRGKRQLREGH